MSVLKNMISLGLVVDAYVYCVASYSSCLLTFVGPIVGEYIASNIPSS